jgi:hypothetical protein
MKIKLVITCLILLLLKACTSNMVATGSIDPGLRIHSSNTTFHSNFIPTVLFLYQLFQ